MSNAVLRVGLAGAGTVGGGTWTVLTRNADEIARRAGRPIAITGVSDLDAAKVNALTGGKAKFYADAMEMAKSWVSGMSIIRPMMSRDDPAKAACVRPMMQEPSPIAWAARAMFSAAMPASIKG